jgi:thymidylate synthase
MIHFEYQYLKLIRKIIKDGYWMNGRNGKVKTLVGETMRFPLYNDKIPILTTKKVPWKVCLNELLWFIRGDTNNDILKKQNVKIWNKNATRNFLNSRGLYHLEENDLGPIYGHQWRFWNASYFNCHTHYHNKGIDQLNNIICDLKKNNFSRRLIMTAWNPEQIDEMALPPCHVLSQFHVNDKYELSCSLYQRSGDVGLGIPFNILSYSFLTCLIAHHCNLNRGEFIHHIGNAHIYENHINTLEQQITLEPYDFPKLYIKNKYENIDDYILSDFEIINYKSHKIKKMDMIA